jgi:hypothetical protein
MVKLLSIIFSIFYIPYMVFKEEETGKNWKVKLNFLKIFTVIQIKYKKKVRLGDLKIIKVTLDKNYFKKEYIIKDLKMIDTSNFTFKDMSWNDKQLNLKEIIKNGGYVSGLNTYISTTKDYVIIDGYHRVASLKEKYGDDYKITIKKNIYNYKTLFKNVLHYMKEIVKDEKVEKLTSLEKSIIEGVPYGGGNLDNIKEEIHKVLVEKDSSSKTDYIILNILWDNTYKNNKIPIDE